MKCANLTVIETVTSEKLATKLNSQVNQRRPLNFETSHFFPIKILKTWTYLVGESVFSGYPQIIGLFHIDFVLY